MTPLELMNLAKPMADLYTGLETDLIKNIADFLLDQNLESSTAKWKINKLAQLGALNKSNIKTIAEYTKIVPEMLSIALTGASLKAINELEPGFKELVKEGILKATTVPIDTSMANIIKTFYEQATEKYNLVNTVMKYKAKSTAQKIINDTAELANKQEFLDILNKATGKVVTGIESRRTALSQCIKEMCQKGIPAFTDKLGREWSPEAYVNMDIRTTCSNVANKSQFKRMDDYGVSLIEISSHNGARPKCAKYQGTIVDRSGKSKKYRSLKDTSYGEPDGLFGINCGHKPYPFIEGVSIQRYFPYNEDENAEQYKKFQQQRQLERDVRSAKRECMVMDTLGDKDGFTKASIKLKAKQNKLKQYCKDNDLTYKADRTATPGYGKSMAGKVTGASNSKHKQWLKNIGAEDSELNTIDKYYNAKYNNAKEYNLLKYYSSYVNKGTVSPLSTFKNYKEMIAEVDKKLVGVTTSNGIKITSQSNHFVERVLGTGKDPKTDKKREGVTIEEMHNALTSPLNEPKLRVDDRGKSIKFISEKATISVAPDGTLIQCNPTSHDMRNSLLKKQKEKSNA